MLEIVARVLFFELALLAAIGGIALLTDALWRRSWSRRPDVELHPCEEGDSDTVFVVLPTHQMQTRLLMKNIIEQLTGYAAVYRVEGAELRFDAEWIIDEITESVHRYRRIVLVAPGPSLMLAVNIANELDRFPIAGREVSIITIDGIPSSMFVSSKNLEIARLPLGPVANWIMSQLQQLKRWTRWNYVPSLWRDYMKFVRTWAPEGRPNASLVYIRSERTQEESLFMAPSLAEFLVEGGLIETITVPDADELDILLYPQRYKTAVERTLQLLEIEKVA